MKARQPLRAMLPAILTGAVVILTAACIAEAYTIHALCADGFTRSDSGMPPFAGLSYAFKEASDTTTPTYVITMAVKGGRAFTMPVRFTQSGRPVQVPSNDATAFANEWIRARAIGVAQAYSRMDPNGQPYLPIPVEHPGTP
jgi:hypothetical protein